MLNNLNSLKNALETPLPGTEAQYIMAPVARQKYDLSTLNAENYKASAVIILLCLDDYGNPFIPLTERASYNGVHSGQISLPGGKFEPTDESLEKTALRECFEEIGLKDEVEILGKLSKLYIPVSGFLVEPFVGLYKMQNPNFLAHEKEVKKIIKFPLAHLLNEETVKTGLVENRGKFKITAPYFLIENHKVWGATAMILNELKVILKTIV